jgi:peptidoglycan/xylan/chitin deacetylase (PgdA/CDA1 family)
MPVRDKAVLLTFDDGPHPDTTQRLLDILQEYGVRATFFVSGSQAEKYPDIVRSIKSRGHAVGNHSFCHARIAETGIVRYCRDIRKTSAVLKRILNERVSLYRSPYGEFSAALIVFLLMNDLKYAGWTIDSGDAFVNGKDDLIRRLGAADIRSGDILLFHDDSRHTVEAMPAILSDLRERGFSFSALSGL